jgi:hypothetical protein
MFIEKNKGKIIITVEDENNKLNSSLVRRGIAKKTGVALTTLLINFVSLAIKEDLDPAAIVHDRLDQLIAMVKNTEKK